MNWSERLRTDLTVKPTFPNVFLLDCDAQTIDHDYGDQTKNHRYFDHRWKHCSLGQYDRPTAQCYGASAYGNRYAKETTKINPSQSRWTVNAKVRTFKCVENELRLCHSLCLYVISTRSWALWWDTSGRIGLFTILLHCWPGRAGGGRAGDGLFWRHAHSYTRSYVSLLLVYWPVFYQSSFYTHFVQRKCHCSYLCQLKFMVCVFVVRLICIYCARGLLHQPLLVLESGQTYIISKWPFSHSEF